MTRLTSLPHIMLAPNGARKTKADHPALPLTIAETVVAARAAHAEGAGALHAHVRDASGGHSLDAGLYRELIAEMARAVPDMPVQITTEAAGRYSPADQRAVVRAVRPEGVSVALGEMWPDSGHDPDASGFYHWAAEAGIPVQHILYSPADVTCLSQRVAAGAIPTPLQLLFVLGRYQPPKPAIPNMLTGFLRAARTLPGNPDWAACAFGPQETDCLLTAITAGGKARIGFENNLKCPEGTRAPDNATRVADLVRRLPLASRLSSRTRIPHRASSPL